MTLTPFGHFVDVSTSRSHWTSESSYDVMRHFHAKTSWYRLFGTGYIIRKGEWQIYMNFVPYFQEYFFLFYLFIGGRHSLHISAEPFCNTHGHMKLPKMKTKFHLNWFVCRVIFVYYSLKYCLKHRSSRFDTIEKEDVHQINYSVKLILCLHFVLGKTWMWLICNAMSSLQI